jgi:hypothetical protein
MSVQLLNPTVISGWQADSFATDLCKYLCNLFVLLSTTDDELKGEFLSV